MTRWEKAIVAAVWIACGYAALVGFLVGLQAGEAAANGHGRP